MADFIQAAFDAVCKEAIPAEAVYVSLIENAPFYGGPEEGGWWGNDYLVVAYQRVATREAADALKARIDKLAAELSAESRRDFGLQCCREMDWLNARGLDADFLPEPDGESTFSVTITDSLPENEYGCRHYE